VIVVQYIYMYVEGALSTTKSPGSGQGQLPPFPPGTRVDKACFEKGLPIRFIEKTDIQYDSMTGFSAILKTRIHFERSGFDSNEIVGMIVEVIVFVVNDQLAKMMGGNIPDEPREGQKDVSGGLVGFSVELCRTRRQEEKRHHQQASHHAIPPKIGKSVQVI
jgi:hypothetical protein